MDGLDVAYRRLHNQFLCGAQPSDPVAVVRHLGAMQSQEYGLAKWSIGQRTRDVSDSVVQRAVDDGAILRTHALRPTWHFVAASDLYWLQNLTGPRVHTVNRYLYRQHGIDADLADRACAVFQQALAGGNHLTRAELGSALANAGIEAIGGRLAYLVMWAELDGLIANGVRRGKQHTYALISERAPDQTQLTADEALAELTRRYFSSHGPATVKDFAWWSSLTITAIRRGLTMLGSALTHDIVDGRTVYFVPDDSPPRPERPVAHIMQPYDEYGVAYTESRSLTNLAGVALPVPNEAVLMLPLVLNGQIVGSWRRTISARGIRVEARPLVSLGAGQRRAVEAAFVRYGEFTGQPVTLDWPDSTPC